MLTWGGRWGKVRLLGGFLQSRWGSGSEILMVRTAASMDQTLLTPTKHPERAALEPVSGQRGCSGLLTPQRGRKVQGLFWALPPPPLCPYLTDQGPGSVFPVSWTGVDRWVLPSPHSYAMKWAFVPSSRRRKLRLHNAMTLPGSSLGSEGPRQPRLHAQAPAAANPVSLPRRPASLRTHTLHLSCTPAPAGGLTP